MKISIIGNGFAALAAIDHLRCLDRSRHIDLTVISPQASFLYHPSLIWIPSGQRSGTDIQCNLERYFRRHGVTHHAGEAVSIQNQGRTVVTTSGSVTNDGLLIAAGATYLKKAPGIEHTVNPCSGVEAATAIHQQLQAMDSGVIAMGFSSNPAEPEAIRGGPLFEFLFGMDTYLRKIGRRDRFKLIFFAPMSEPGKRLGPKAVKGLLSTMQHRDIETHLGKKIVGFAPRQILLEGQTEAIHADMILFLPGMTGSPWLAQTGMELSSGGFLKADSHCRVAGGTKVYVAGDAGSFPGPDWRAKQAHMAELQAKTAVRNLCAELLNQPANHTFRTELICIIDTLDHGIWVSRFDHFNLNLILPPLKPMHRLKQWLESRAMRRYGVG
ncbi:MAG: FAD-dependent oxidoreductase [Magnetococcales bacterium]|nr:FAD-dependent oxidoreductase [Magnetococcales bacterium]